jgi:hypothetical protein
MIGGLAWYDWITLIVLGLFLYRAEDALERAVKAAAPVRVLVGRGFLLLFWLALAIAGVIVMTGA